MEVNLLKRNNVIGDLGEFIFSRSQKYVHRTQETPFRFLEMVPFQIPKEMKNFLITHWYCIDAFKFHLTPEFTLEIFEIKTSSVIKKKELFKKRPLTKKQVQMIKEAREHNWLVTAVFVQLHDNWNASIQTKKLDYNDFFESEGGPNAYVSWRRKYRPHEQWKKKNAPGGTFSIKDRLLD